VVDYLCPANDLCFQDSEFDTVFSTQTLEHVADHRGMVAEAFRVLRPGGYAIFTVPFSWELHEEPYDFFRVSKYGLKYLFEGSGFEVIRIKANGGKWAAISQLFLNVLMSTRKYVTFRSRLIKLLFIRMRLIIPYNKISIWLDKRFFDDVFTLNYIIVARKHN
jgi:ubiquinone/menaquinone biosynthesis C-methylase UbiE